MAELAALRAQVADLAAEVTAMRAQNSCASFQRSHSEPRVCVASLVPPRQLYNMSFEEGIAGWVLDYWCTLATEQVSTEQAHTGTHALKHVIASGANGGSYYDSPSGTNAILVEGARYFISAWLWANTPESSVVWLHDIGSPSSGALQVSGDSARPNQWQLVGGVFTATATRRVRIHLHSSAADNVFWDDVEVVEESLDHWRFRTGASTPL